MNKTVYLRQSVLDLSKITMYKFHYDYMKPKYSENLQLYYMDNDSLIYDIKTDDFYEDIASDIKARFDRSHYSHKWVHPLPIGENKKVIGLMKDELGGRIMTKSMALRPKLYAYKTLSGSGDIKVQGSQEVHHVIKKVLDFEDYKQCLHLGKNAFWKQLPFRNRKPEVHTVEVNKVTLSRDDDKRVIQSDSLSMLAHGHKDAVFQWDT